MSRERGGGELGDRGEGVRSEFGERGGGKGVERVVSGKRGEWVGIEMRVSWERNES